MKAISKKLSDIIFDSDQAIRREQITIKARLLFDYLNLPMQGPTGFDRWLEELTGSRFLRPRPGDRLVKIDDDGDVAVAQPYAEMFLLNNSHTFGGALGLILMTEACYLCNDASPEKIIPILSKFQPLAKSNGLAPLSLLHEFLLIEEDLTDWFYELMQQYGMLTQQDFARPNFNSISTNNSSSQEGPVVSPMMAAKIAVADPNIHGRKMKACLVTPKVSSIELDKNCPALLELLLTKPPQGAPSRHQPHFQKAI